MIIKFNMSVGDTIVVNEKQAQQILENSKQIVMIFDDAGKWTGKTINKSHIVSTTVETGEAQEPAYNQNQLPAPGKEFSEEEKKRNRDKIDAMRKNLAEKFGWKK